MSALWFPEAIDEAVDDDGNGDYEEVCALATAYFPTVTSTLHVERTFNDLRRAERTLTNAAMTSSVQLHCVAAKSLQRQSTEGPDKLKVCTSVQLLG